MKIYIEFWRKRLYRVYPYPLQFKYTKDLELVRPRKRGCTKITKGRPNKGYKKAGNIIPGLNIINLHCCQVLAGHW